MASLPMQCVLCCKGPFSGVQSAEAHFSSAAHKKKEASQKVQNSSNFCDICNVPCNTVIMLHRHCESPRHKAMEEKNKQLGGRSVATSPMATSLNASQCHASYPIATTLASSPAATVVTSKSGTKCTSSELSSDHSLENIYTFDGQNGECKLCEVKLSSHQVKKKHLNSDKHRRNLYLYETGFLRKVKTCNACNITFDSPEMQEQHFNSDKHKKNMKNNQMLGPLQVVVEMDKPNSNQVQQRQVKPAKPDYVSFTEIQQQLQNQLLYNTDFPCNNLDLQKSKESDDTNVYVTNNKQDKGLDTKLSKRNCLEIREFAQTEVKRMPPEGACEGSTGIQFAEMSPSQHLQNSTSPSQHLQNSRTIYPGESNWVADPSIQYLHKRDPQMEVPDRTCNGVNMSSSAMVEQKGAINITSTLGKQHESMWNSLRSDVTTITINKCSKEIPEVVNNSNLVSMNQIPLKDSFQQVSPGFRVVNDNSQEVLSPDEDIISLTFSDFQSMEPVGWTSCLQEKILQDYGVNPEQTTVMKEDGRRSQAADPIRRMSASDQGHEYDFDGSRGFCHVCQIDFTSREHATQHLNGSKHAKNKRQWEMNQFHKGQELQIPNSGSHEQRNSSMNNCEKEYLFDGKKGYCNVCQIDLTSEQHATQHLNGAKHIKAKRQWEISKSRITGTTNSNFSTQNAPMVSQIPVEMTMAFNTPGTVANDAAYNTAMITSTAQVTTRATNTDQVKFMTTSTTQPTNMVNSHDNHMNKEETQTQEYLFDGSRGYCNVCKIELTSRQHATQHLNGKNHTKAKTIWLAAQARSQPQNSQAAVSTYVQHDLGTTESPVIHSDVEYKFGGTRGFCDICKVDFSSEQHALQHLEGIDHAKAKSAWLLANQMCDRDGGQMEQCHPNPNVSQHHEQNASNICTTNIRPEAVVDLPEYTFTGTRGYCNICKIELTSANHADQHLQGKPHANARDIWKQELLGQNLGPYYCRTCIMTFTGPEPLEQHNASERHKKKVEQDNNVNLYCDICMKSFSGPLSADQHYASDRHKKMASLNAGNIVADPDGLVKDGVDSTGALLTEDMSSLKLDDSFSLSTGSGPSRYLCDTCGITVNSLEQLDRHKQSPKHLDLVEKKKAKMTPSNSSSSSLDSLVQEDKTFIQRIVPEQNVSPDEVTAVSSQKSQKVIPECNLSQEEMLSKSISLLSQMKLPEKNTSAKEVDDIKLLTQITIPQQNVISFSCISNSDGDIPVKPQVSLYPSSCTNEHSSILHQTKDTEMSDQNTSVEKSQENYDEKDSIFLPETMSDNLKDQNGKPSGIVKPEITSETPVQIPAKFVTLSTNCAEETYGACNEAGGTKRGETSDLARMTSNRPVKTKSAQESQEASCRNQDVNSPYKYCCIVCSRPMDTYDAYLKHVSGKQHMQKVAKEPAPVRNHPGLQFSTATNNLRLARSHLRDYQEELFVKAMERDTVCFLPTGTGKTLVSVMVIESCLRQNPTRQVLFLVDRVLLVLQQSKYIITETKGQKYIRFDPQNHKDLVERELTVAVLCGGQQSTDGIPLWKHDVIVVTAAFCQNLLAKGILRWDDFSLVVFDEAHHCEKNHPFSQLLKTYHLPMPKSDRPKLIGLTASPAGRQDVQRTIIMLQGLLNNLGGAFMSVVEDNVSTLRKFQSNAQIIIHSAPPRDQEVSFAEELKVYMLQCYLRLKELSDIEFYMEKSFATFNMSMTEVELREKVKSLSMDDFDVLQCNLLCARPNENKVGDKFFVHNLCQHIGNICITLNVLMEAGYEVAMEELKELKSTSSGNFQFARDNNLPCSKFLTLIEMDMKDTDFKKESNLHQIVRLVCELTNPDNIAWQSGNQNMMALVLVKERRTAHKIQKILEFNGQIKELGLKVACVVGHGSGAADGGMRVNQQKRVLEEIKNHVYQIVVATSVAEEGLDLPECELVVSLMPPSTVTALVQMRGRARKMNSKFIVLCNNDKEEAKLIDLLQREENMVRASKILVDMDRKNQAKNNQL
ncbi:hypothetical protein ACJMK2_019994 [Sinanodonta woodiana]|uniref:Uncharacterized protein n=1 Tax=Sinanodonta woodiana TaxID=1069815 RepID=A0ABD3TYQ0_SINWO